MTLVRDRFARLAPPFAWMGVIALLSGDLLAAEETGSRLLPVLAYLFPGSAPSTLHTLHALVRKLGHLVEYGILGALWLRAVAPGRSTRRAAAWTVGLAAAYAILDEARQSAAPSRSPSGVDVAIDTAGAFLAVAWLQAPGGFATAGIRVGRWAAWLLALASLAAAAFDWTLGLAAWDLGLAAAGSALAAWGLRGLEQRWRSAGPGSGA